MPPDRARSAKTPSLSLDAAPPAPPRGGSLARFFNFERRWLMHVFEIVIPSGADPRLPMGAAQAPMGAFVDHLLERAPLEFVLGLRACLWMTLLAPLFVLGRPRSFFALSPGEQRAVIDRMRTSSLYLVRETPLLFKTVGCLAFCGLPAVQRKLGIYPTDAVAPDWARPREHDE
jgi:hypothetical protein